MDFPLETLEGKQVLGCGTGRFAEIVLKYGGTVVGVAEAVNKNETPLA